MSKITKPMFKKALEDSLGTQRDMSKRLKVSDSGMSRYLERNLDMAELLNKHRLKNIDKAEHEIFKQLKFNDSKNKSAGARVRQTAAQFILSRLGKNSGWVEKTEVEHSGDQQIIFQEIIKSNEEIKEMKDAKRNNSNPKAG